MTPTATVAPRNASFLRSVSTGAQPFPARPNHPDPTDAMQISGELIGLSAVVMGGLAILIPVAGITARIALKPIVEAMARYREMKGDDMAVNLLEQRMRLMEEQLHGMDRSLRLLVEDADFRRRLETSAPVSAAALGPGPREPGA
jgi:Zn-dependent protease with chaperone function